MVMFPKPFAIAALFAGLAALPSPSATAHRCHTGPFIIFFEPDSAKLDGGDRSTLDRAVEIANTACNENSRIMAAGFADTASDKKHHKISEKRAKAVSDYFSSKGIKRTRLMHKAFGDEHPLIVKPAGVGEAQHRRVEVTFGPPSPMRLPSLE